MKHAFVYKARGSLGEVSGVILAERATFARAKLKRMSLRTTSLRYSPYQTIVSGFKKEFDQDELAQFYRYLSRLQKKGIPLASSLSDAVSTVSDIHLKGSIAMMAESASASGVSLSQAMALGGFPERDVNLVRNVEEAGEVDEVLSSMAEEIHRAQGLRRSIRKMLTMPTILFFLIVVLMYAGIVFVAPSIHRFFTEVLTNVPIPRYAVAYYEACAFFNRNLIIGTILYVAAVIGFIFFVRSKYVAGLMQLIGPVRIARLKADYAALWGAFGTLYKAGVHKEEVCLGLAKAAKTDEARHCFGRMASLLRDGRNIDEAVVLARFPLYISNPICAAYRSHSVPNGAKELSEKLIIDVETFSGTATTWIEVAIYIFLAMFVFAFASLSIIPMLLALFSAV